MASTYRELALFEAFKTHWIATGCPDVLPNGIYWPDAPIGTEMPYAVLATISNVSAGFSNKGEYRDVVLQVTVFDRDDAASTDGLDGILPRLLSQPMEIAPEEGQIYSLTRGPVRHIKIEEGVHQALVDLEIGRRVGR